MNEEEKKAAAWFNGLSRDEVRELIVQSYRDHLKHTEELKALGFKWGVE